MPKKVELTWSALADALGTTTKSLRTWRTMPDAPRSPDLPAWLAFKATHGLNKGRSAELTEIKLLIAREELKKRRRENEILENDFVAVAAVVGHFQELVRRSYAVFRRICEMEAPARFCGKDRAGCNAEGRMLFDEFVEYWNQEMDKESKFVTDGAPVEPSSNRQ